MVEATKKQVENVVDLRDKNREKVEDLKHMI